MFLCSEYEQCTDGVSSKDKSERNGPINVPFRCSDGVVLLVDMTHAQEFKAPHLDEIHERRAGIPLPNVSSDILKVIVEYCDNHIPIRQQREAALALAAIGGAEYEGKLEELEEKEGKKYLQHCLKLDYRTLVQLSNAANFLYFQEFLERMHEALISKVMEMNKIERAVVADELDNIDDEDLREEMDCCLRYVF